MEKRNKPSRTRKPQPKPLSHQDSLSPKPPSLNQAGISLANTIIQLSHKREAQLLTLGKLIFFSTKTGDAWILDPDEGQARCLSLDGEKLPFTVNESSADFGIDWDSEYRIKGRLFTVLEYSGPVRTILGYPTHHIEEAIRLQGV